MKNNASDFSLHMAMELCELSIPVFRRLKGELKSEISENLTLTQLWALLAIQLGHDQVSTLVENFQIAQPAISKLIKPLLQQDLIQRAPLPEDRRQHKLSLTPSGQALIERVRQRSARHYQTALLNLSPAERDQLSAGLQIMRKIIVTPPQTERRTADD